MRFVLAGLVLATALGARPSSVQAGHAIVLDGEFDDWRRVPLSIRDPADAPGSPVDFGEVRVTSDDRFLFGFVECRRPIDVDGLGELGTISMLFDADGNPETGRPMFGMPGVDMAVDLSPAGSGVLVRAFPAAGETPADAPPETIGFRMAPAYTTTRFEFRFDRGTRSSSSADRWLAGSRAVVKLVFQQGSGGVTSAGSLRLRDETAALSVSLPAWAPVKPSTAEERVPAIDPLARGAGSDFRALVWNVGHFPEAARERAGAVLRALNADVLLLDELGDEAAVALQSGLVRNAGAEEPWYLVSGNGTGVVARGRATVRLGRIPYPAEGFQRVVDAVASGQPADQRADLAAALEARGVTALGAVATLGRRQLFAVSLGLQCCGGAAREERRMVEARAIQAAARQAMTGARPDAVLVGGDFNLVGTRGPLDTLTRGLDWDGSALGVVRALTLDGRASDTWRSARD